MVQLAGSDGSGDPCGAGEAVRQRGGCEEELGLQQEESALSQQLEQSSKRLEWLSSLPSSGARQPVAPPRPALTSGRVWCAATPMQEDVEAIAKQVDEVRSVVASIGQGLGQIDGGRPAAAAGGSGDLSGAVAQFEKDKAATSTAGRDDLQKLSAVATQ